MLNYNAPNVGISSILAAALSGALPSQNVPGMQSPGALQGRVDSQNSSAFMPVPQQQQQQPQSPMGQMGGNPYASLLSNMHPQSPSAPQTGTIPGYGQVTLPNMPNLQPQGPLSGVLPWLRGMIGG